MPLHLAKEYGGWKNRKLIDFYERFAQTVLERYSSKVKYWMTFNEINSAFHFPALSQGLVKSNGAGEYQNIFQAWHNQFVASSKAVKSATNCVRISKIGCMIIYASNLQHRCQSSQSGSNNDPNQEFNFFCTDVQVRGEYPAYTARTHKKYGVDPEKLEQTEEDFPVAKRISSGLHRI